MNNNFIDRRNKSVSYEDWISQNFDIINEIIFEFIINLKMIPLNIILYLMRKH